MLWNVAKHPERNTATGHEARECVFSAVLKTILLQTAPFVDLNRQIFDFLMFILLPQKILICSIFNFFKFETTADIKMDSFIWKILEFMNRTIPNRQIIGIQFFQRTVN